MFNTFEDFDCVKYIFFDVDGVLSAPRYVKNGEYVMGYSDEEWLSRCVTYNPYKDCIAPKLMQDFVLAMSKTKKLFALTTDFCSFSYYNKTDFLRSNYVGFSNLRDIITVGKDSMKIDVIKEIAKRDGLQLSECMLIEDTYQTAIGADLQGIYAVHVSHIFDFASKVFK